MKPQKIRKIKAWCPVCDTAILSGTICPNCRTDTNKYKKKENNFNRKPLRD